MSTRDPKNKTISFRLSQQEYIIADQARHERSFENMSDLARCAVLAYSKNPPETANSELESMKQRLEAVAQQVETLTRRFEGNQVHDFYRKRKTGIINLNASK